jgi:L-alanine-DL-glutamate epimerase-like enolase superfamily enzyme
MQADLEARKQMVEKFAFTDPERYWHYLHHLFPKNNFLVCALDIAGWDLFGKLRNKKLYELWAAIFQNPLTDYTIGIDNIDTMVAKMKEKPGPSIK